MFNNHALVFEQFHLGVTRAGGEERNGDWKRVRVRVDLLPKREFVFRLNYREGDLISILFR